MPALVSSSLAAMLTCLLLGDVPGSAAAVSPLISLIGTLFLPDIGAAVPSTSARTGVLAGVVLVVLYWLGLTRWCDMAAAAAPAAMPPPTAPYGMEGG